MSSVCQALIWQRFETFFICTLNASKVIFVTFNFNLGLRAASIGKPSERISNFWTV